MQTRLRGQNKVPDPTNQVGLELNWIWTSNYVPNPEHMQLLNFFNCCIFYLYICSKIIENSINTNYESETNQMAEIILQGILHIYQQNSCITFILCLL